jgi:hypothetical protein
MSAVSSRRFCRLAGLVTDVVAGVAFVGQVQIVLVPDLLVDGRHEVLVGHDGIQGFMKRQELTGETIQVHSAILPLRSL